MTTFVKSDDGVLDYKIDYTAWLASGDTVSTSVWVVPSDLTENSSTNDTTSTSIVISGGTAGTEYTVQNTITTAVGLTDERCFKLFVTDCR